MFSRDAKDEVAGVPVRTACCAATFLRGCVRFGSSRTDAAGTIVSTGRASVARAIIAAAHLEGIDARIVPAATSKAPVRFRVRIPTDATSFGVRSRADIRTRTLHALPARRCCQRAQLRAAFLMCGSVSDPTRGHHLELNCPTDSAARDAFSLVGALGIDAALARRRGRPLVYVKHADAVSALLGHMGATHAVLRMADQRAISQTKNSIRRTVNSETANAARAAASAARQREAASRVLATPAAAHMSKAVREAARLRIAYPSRTLRELARTARPPISKAAMASRLRLLERLAKR